MSEGELDIDAISHASELINSTLISKGYLADKLLFNSINWQELTRDQVSVSDDPFLETDPEQDANKNDLNLSITDTIYNNDKNIINIIYSLLQTIERNKVQKESFNRIISKHENDVLLLKNENMALTKKLHNKDLDILRLSKQNNEIANSLKTLESSAKLNQIEFTKLKNFNSSLKMKYEVEVRKKDIQLSKLKDKLLQRKVKNFASIYDNNPILSDVVTGSDGSVINEELEKIIIDLSNLINNLISENNKFLKFMNQLNSYLIGQNGVLENQGTVNMKGFFADTALTNGGTGGRQIDDLIDDMESFEDISGKVMESLLVNNGKIADLMNDRKTSNDEEIKSLRSELAVVTQNWNDAIRTMENWKSYRDS